MSKIDLSKAKVGDKFRTKNDEVVTYIGTDCCIEKSRSDYYVCVCSDDVKIRYFKNGAFLSYEGHPYDLVEQVFEDDKMEREIKSQKEMQEAVGIEDEAELQRRKEVVELADRIFTEKYLQEWYQYLIDNNTAKTDYVTYIFELAEKFVNTKDKYLKEGKL